MFWVIAMFCGLVIYLVNDRYRTHQAISWWQNRQIDRLHQETELIRDGMLQDLFSLRRSLGVMIDGSQAESKLEPTLAIADRCHTELAGLSDRLFSPYAIESLEAALHELVGRWKASHSESSFGCTVEGRLEEVGKANYQFLLIWLDEFCRLLMCESQPVDLKLTLRQEEQRLYLNCAVQSESVRLMPLDQVSHLKRVFTTTQIGRCTIKFQEDQYLLQLRW